ncbi:MAG: Hsp70 family protein, partial [Muribaculaceae bacterium]|nr:Hsp70 family protein [Muribaculaceae bacterium]
MQIALNSNAIDFGFGATRYAMPTVVSVANGNYYIGNQALNTKLGSDAYFDKFKTALERDDEYASPELKITYHELICKILHHVRECVIGSESINTVQLIDKIILTVPVSTVPYGNRWNRMLKAANEVFPEVKSVEILLEPIAAGYALLGERIHSNKGINGKYFIIYDFGGGTFDTTILKVEDGQIYVVGKSVGSDDEQRWGGIYIDDLIKREYIKNGASIRRAIDSVNYLSPRERFNL